MNFVAEEIYDIIKKLIMLFLNSKSQELKEQ